MTDYTANPLAAANALLERVRPEHRDKWGTLPTTATGTAKAWLTARHGTKVDTLQVTADTEGRLASGWAPGPREVDASRATYATFDGSRRDYAGMTVVAANDTHLVAVAPWGDDAVQVAIYRTTN